MESLRFNNSDGSVDVQIKEEVIAIIAGLAATEIEGVSCMAGGITNEIIEKLGRKNLAAGVQVHRKDGLIYTDLFLVVEMGCNIPEVGKQVQEKVKSSIETMTGLKVGAVNIHIANVNIDN